MITEPYLDLVFTGGDLEEGHEEETTLGPGSIVTRSISISRTLISSSMRSSSDTAELTIARGAAAIEDIIRTEGDVKAVLRDGDATLFTGYVSTSLSWAVGDTGDSSLQITLEDTGTRLLKKSFITSGRHLFNCTAASAVEAICGRAGVTISADTSLPSTAVVHVVEDTSSCADLLGQLCYELGYVYHFNEYGFLCLSKISCDSTDGLPAVDSGSLVTVSGNAIRLSKDIHQYRQAEVTYERLAEADGYLVYRDTTGQDDDHPYCYHELGAGECFDGTENYGADDADLRTEAYIEACNAESETDLVGSNEIIAVTAVETEYASSYGCISAEVTTAGGSWLSVHAENTGSLDGYLTRLDAYGSIIYVQDENTAIASATDTGDEDGETLEEELEWVHDDGTAAEHAALIASYFSRAGSKYTFYSFLELEPGTVVSLVDDVFTLLEASVIITGRTETDESDVFTYSAAGVSAFDLGSASVTRYASQKISLKGEAGADGADGEDSVIGFQYRLSSSADESGAESGALAYTDDDGESGIITYDGQAVLTDDWLDYVPETTGDEPYVWMRTWNGATGEYDEWRVTGTEGADGADGEDGADAETFLLQADPAYYTLTSRSVTAASSVWSDGAQRISASVTRYNTEAAADWSVSGPLSWSYTEDGDDSAITITIPAMLALLSFTVTCSLGGETKSVTVAGVPSGAEEALYLGVVTEDGLSELEESGTSEGPLIYGDHVLLEDADAGTRTPYWWDGEAWVMADADTDTGLAWKIAEDTLYDALQAEGTASSSSVTNLYAANLAAFNAFIYSLKARHLEVGDGSVSAYDDDGAVADGDEGEGFLARVYDYSGGAAAGPVFDVWYSGRCLFKIAPASGRIFIGEPDWSNTDSATGEPRAAASGFMLNPETDALEGPWTEGTSTPGISIGADGSVTMAGGLTVSGSLSAEGGGELGAGLTFKGTVDIEDAFAVTAPVSSSADYTFAASATVAKDIYDSEAFPAGTYTKAVLTAGGVETEVYVYTGTKTYTYEYTYVVGYTTGSRAVYRAGFFADAEGTEQYALADLGISVSTLTSKNYSGKGKMSLSSYPDTGLWLWYLPKVKYTALYNCPSEDLVLTLTETGSRVVMRNLPEGSASFSSGDAGRVYVDDEGYLRLYQG